MRDTKIIRASAFFLIFLVLLQFFINFYITYSKYKNLQEMEKLNDFSLVISALVHNIQQERESGIKYLENKTDKYKLIYNNDIKNTDTAIKKYKKYLSKNHLDFEGFVKDLKKIDNYFEVLKKEREEIKNFQMNENQEINFYTKLNRSLLSILHIFVKKATDVKLVKALMGYLAFERLKESIGIERTILSVTFSNNKWNQELYIRYIQILTRQQVFLFQSLMMANKEIRDYYHKIMDKNFLAKIKKIENIAMYKRENFGIDSNYVYDLMTKKITTMKKLDKKYYERNIDIINEIKNNVFLKILLNLGLSLIVILFVLYNLSRLHKENRNLKDKVIYDSLTGVYSRLFFMSEFEFFRLQADKLNKKLAILFIDLDGFKAVNDTLGHKIGDEVLKEAANRIKSKIRQNDIVARFGGDEFLLLLNGVDDLEIVKKIAKNILEELRNPIIINNKIAHISASIGISIYPDDGEDIETLLKQADKKMYKSKESGKDRITLS